MPLDISRNFYGNFIWSSLDKSYDSFHEILWELCMDTSGEIPRWFSQNLYGKFRPQSFESMAMFQRQVFPAFRQGKSYGLLSRFRRSSTAMILQLFAKGNLMVYRHVFAGVPRPCFCSFLPRDLIVSGHIFDTQTACFSSRNFTFCFTLFPRTFSLFRTDLNSIRQILL